MQSICFLLIKSIIQDFKVINLTQWKKIYEIFLNGWI